MKTADNPELWKPKAKQKLEKKQPKNFVEKSSEAEESEWKPRPLPLAYADHTVSNDQRETPPG